jgi:hypothetical protein
MITICHSQSYVAVVRMQDRSVVHHLPSVFTYTKHDCSNIYVYIPFYSLLNGMQALYLYLYIYFVFIFIFIGQKSC